MKFSNVRPAFGPSLYAPESCIWIGLATSPEERGMLEGVMDDLVGLAKQACLNGGFSELDESGLPDETMSRFAWLVGQLACRQADSFGRSLSGPWVRPWEGEWGATLAIGLTHRMLWPEIILGGLRRLLADCPKAIEQRLPAELRGLAAGDEHRGTRLFEVFRESLQVDLFQKAARERGLPVLRLSDFGVEENVLQIGFGKGQCLLFTTYTAQTSFMGDRISGYKEISQKLLGGLGVPVPAQQKVIGAEQAVKAAELIGYPVVVKPSSGGKGGGVSIYLERAEEVRRAFAVAMENNWRPKGTAIVESFVEGNDYRVAVCCGQLLSVVQRVPAQVIGDGKHSVRELIEIVNRDPNRGDGVSTHLKRLALDDIALDVLGKQGMTPDAVPEPDQRVRLRFIANVSAGGAMLDVTERIHPDNRELSEAIAEEFGLDLVGIDFMGADIGRSYQDGSLKVLEVNAGPGLQGPPTADGGFRDLPGEALDRLMAQGERAAVPIVLVLAPSEACLPWTRALTSVWSRSQTGVGLAAGEERRVGKVGLGNEANPVPGDPAFGLLRSRRVEAVVVQRSLNEVASMGIGSAGCDFAIFLPNIMERREESPTNDSISLDQRVAELLAKEARQGVLIPSDHACLAAVLAAGPKHCCITAASSDLSNLESQFDLGASDAREFCFLDEPEGVIRWRSSGTGEVGESRALGSREKVRAWLGLDEEAARDADFDLLLLATLQRLGILDHHVESLLP